MKARVRMAQSRSDCAIRTSTLPASAERLPSLVEVAVATSTSEGSRQYAAARRAVRAASAKVAIANTIATATENVIVGNDPIAPWFPT